MRRWIALAGCLCLCHPAASFAQDQAAAVTCCRITVPAQGPVPNGLFLEPRPLTGLTDVILNNFNADRKKPDGFYPRFGAVLPGGGWIAVGPGNRRHVLGDRVLIDGSGAVSWRTYRIAQVRMETTDLAAGHFTVGTQWLWQDVTQANFFGLGSDIRRADRTEYRLRAADTTAYAVVRAGVLSLEGRGGHLGRPAISGATGWHDGGFPDARNVFSESTAPGLTQQPRFWHGDVALTANTLDHPGHPTSGGLYQLALEAYHDRDLGRFSFHRYEITAAQFVPMVANKWTLAARGSVALTGTSNGNVVPIYLLPSVGGQNALRGYLDYQFQDRNVAALSVESRLAIYAHLDGAIFVDTAEVAPEARLLGRSGVKSSCGVGVRIHTGKSTLMRFDVARSAQGWRLQFRLSDPFVFTSLNRWASLLPVVPLR